MSIITIYKCDKCGNESNTDAQFWRLKVDYQCVGTSHAYGTHASMYVCRNCLESFGIYAKKETRESPDYNPPSIEDFIREIIREEISNTEN